MLGSGRIDLSTQLEETRRVPLCGVGYDLVEQRLKTLGLRDTSVECKTDPVRSADLEDGGDVDNVGVR